MCSSDLLGRWLWQALAVLVVAHNLTLIATTQFSPERLLSAVLVWGGALLCLEHRLPRLRPRPDWTGLILGSLLLLACLLRSNQLLVRDGLIFLLAPIQGLALALLCRPRRQLVRLWEPLLVLALLPLSLPLQTALPERALSWLTARLAQGWLRERELWPVDLDRCRAALLINSLGCRPLQGLRSPVAANEKPNSIARERWHQCLEDQSQQP